MRLDEKIFDRRVHYKITNQPAIAFELALLYYILAKRRTCDPKISDACQKAWQWLERAGVEGSNQHQLSLTRQLNLIEKLLVKNRSILLNKQADVRYGEHVGARRCQLVDSFAC